MGGGYGTDPSGPHSSHMTNKADPRVDSDYSGGIGNTRATGGGYGTDPGAGNIASTGGYRSHETTGATGSDPSGPHNSRLANKLDPRVGSDSKCLYRFPFS